MLKSLLFYLLISGFSLVGINGQNPAPFSNKGDLDGSVMVGNCFPWSDHRNGQFNGNSPAKFATRGVAIRAEANAGFGNGWKIGLGLEVYWCDIDAEALSGFLQKSVVLPNYYFTRELSEDPYYITSNWFVKVENDIDVKRLRFSPHAKIGIASFGVGFRNTYYLKEMGSNYENKVTVTPYPSAIPGFSYGAGLKAGFSPGGSEGKFFYFACLDVMRYRTVTGLQYDTQDILGTTTYTQDWYRATISYYDLVFGVSYYLR